MADAWRLIKLSVLHLGLLDQALSMDDFSDWSCLFCFTFVVRQPGSFCTSPVFFFCNVVEADPWHRESRPQLSSTGTNWRNGWWTCSQHLCLQLHVRHVLWLNVSPRRHLQFWTCQVYLATTAKTRSRLVWVFYLLPPLSSYLHLLPPPFFYRLLLPSPSTTPTGLMTSK